MTRVLVVDDEADIRELLAYRLNSLGHEVFLEADADAGLAAALDITPQVILLDWQMPHRNGIEVCAELRSHRDFDDAGIFVLSARRKDGDRQRALAAGADDYLVKPSSVTAVVARLESYLRTAATCESFAGCVR